MQETRFPGGFAVVCENPARDKVSTSKKSNLLIICLVLMVGSKVEIPNSGNGCVARPCHSDAGGIFDLSTDI